MKESVNEYAHAHWSAMVGKAIDDRGFAENSAKRGYGNDDREDVGGSEPHILANTLPDQLDTLCRSVCMA